MGLLLWALGGLGLVVLVGHLGWVLAARLLGFRVTTVRPRKSQATFPPAPLAAHNIRAHLTRLYGKGYLDVQTHARILAALQAEEEALKQPSSPFDAVHATPPSLPPPIPVLPLEEDLPASTDDHVDSDQLDEATLIEEVSATDAVDVASEQAFTETWTIEPTSAARSNEGAHAPGRPVSMMLASFMEASNIRWGELIGGLLIVGCSVALVVSFWARIESLPFLRFSLFTAVTAAFFGLGLYIEHRWKLPTTSRGILLIATLLVPLNFLAFAAFSGRPALGWPILFAQLVAFALFAYLVWQASRIIAPAWPHLLMLGLGAQCIAMLVLGRLNLSAASLSQVNLLSLLPLGCYVGTCMPMLATARRWRAMRLNAANAIFLLLSVLTFATALSLGVLLHQLPNTALAARKLIALPCLGGLPALACGLLLWQRINDARLYRLRIAGTAVGVAGALILVGGIALAWPDTSAMLPAAAFDFLALTFVAFLYDIPAAHVLALPCLALGWILGFHLFSDHLAWTSAMDEALAAVSSPRGGAALVPLVLLLTLGRAALLRLHRAAHAMVVVRMATGIAIFSAALVTFGSLEGVHHQLMAAWVYAAYAACAFVWAGRSGQGLPCAAGWALFAGAIIRLFIGAHVGSDPWADALLAFATIASFVGVVVSPSTGRSSRVFATTGFAYSVVACGVVIAMGLGGMSFASSGRTAGTFAWAAAIICVVATAREAPALFIAGQALLYLAAALAVIAHVQSRDWFAHNPSPLGDPWTMQLIALALASIELARMMGLRVLRLAGHRRIPPPVPMSDQTNQDRPAGLSSGGMAGFARSFVRVADSTNAFSSAVQWLLSASLIGIVLFAFVPAAQIELAVASGHKLGIQQQHAIGIGSWALLAALFVLFLEAIASRGGPARLIAVLLTLWAACPLLAARAVESGSAASCLRWLLAGYILLISFPALLRRRPSQSPRVPLRAGRAPIAEWTIDRLTRAATVLLGIFPILFLTIYTVVNALAGAPVDALPADWLFARIGLPAAYVIPLLIIALLLAVDAVRERSQSSALASSLLLCVAVCVGYLLSILHSYRTPWENIVRLLELCALVMSGFSLGWLGARRVVSRVDGDAVPLPLPRILELQASFPMLLNTLVLLPAGAVLALHPFWTGRWFFTAGGPWGWAALLTAISALIAARCSQRDRLSFRTLGICASALAILCGVSVAGLTAGTGWNGIHTMLVGHSLAAWAMVGIGAWIVKRRGGSAILLGEDELPAEPPTQNTVLQYQVSNGPKIRLPVFWGGSDVEHGAVRWAALIGLVVLLLGCRAIVGDPSAPWWSMGSMLAMSMLALVTACWAGRPGFLYLAGLLLNFAASIWYLDRGNRLPGDWWANFLCVNASVLSLPAVAWLVLDLEVFGRIPRTRPGRSVPFHHIVAIASTLLVFLISGIVASARLQGFHSAENPLLAAAALACTCLLLTACLRDPRARYALPGLYCLGVAAAPLALDAVGTSTEWFPWLLATCLGGYALVTSILFRASNRLGTFSRVLRIAANGQTTAVWLPPANTLLAIATLAAAAMADFWFGSLGGRLLLATAAVAQALSLGLLPPQRRWKFLRPASLCVLAGSLVLWIWALAPGTALEMLNRTSGAFILLSIFAALYDRVARRAAWPAGSWREAARPARGLVAGGAVIGLAATLGAEVILSRHSPPANLDHVALAVLATLLGACVFFLRRALSGADTLTLSSRARTRSVYAAEVALALAFVHIRIAEPRWFGGMFAPYWPLVVMIVAFAGVGAAEVFRRRNCTVLSQPLERTSIFLPLIPVIGWWFAPAAHMPLASVMAVVCAFYCVTAAARRSFAMSMLAALAGNAAIWDTLARSEGMRFFQHPQLWLAPAALSVLAAAQLNRRRLNAAQLRAIRYVCLLVVYVSSTADIFLAGVDRAPWLPLVLAGFSVAGVIVGIVYHIRPFLYLGAAFLILSIMTMIWFASSQLHWTWIWYVAGIGLGSAILTLFALFEKKREDVLAVVEGLKQWQ